MIDALTLDQLRIFVAAADAGSFSAAGRKLGRTQSVISQTVANLEGQLGIRLFDRANRYPVLTAAGRALLADARNAVGSVDGLKARARVLSGGLEPELAVAIDAMVPLKLLTEVVTDFQNAFPSTALRLEVDNLGSVAKAVLDGRCAFGVSPLPMQMEGYCRQRIMAVPMLPVVSPRHPLAASPSPVPRPVLSRYIQLVLMDRSDLTKGQNFGVVSSQIWRLADLSAKHAFLKAGLGFGNMPLAMVADDLEAGSLIRLLIEDEPEEPRLLPIFAVYPADMPPGPAGRWFIERLTRDPAMTRLQESI